MVHTSDLVSERVRGVVCRVACLAADQAAFPPDADLFRDLGIDSTAALDLLMSLEDEFAVSIPDDTFGSARSLRAIARLISQLEGTK